MPSVAARLTRQEIIAISPQVSQSGETWQCTSSGIASSNGAADGTTVIDASLSHATDLWNGRYWIEMTSGTYKGQMARIVDDNGSGTFTLEGDGFPGQIDSGDTFRVWLSPEACVVVDSSSGETNMVDAIRSGSDEPDSFWNDYYAVPITGTHRGKIAKVTGFTNSTGTFVLESSFGSALSAGDVVLLVRFIEAEVSMSLSHGHAERRSARVKFARGKGVPLGKGGTVSVTTDLLGSGTLAGAGSAANKSPIKDLLVACGMAENIDTSDIVTSGSTPTAINIGTGKHEQFTIGQAVQINGVTTFVTAKTDGGGSDDTLTVSPALPAAPANGDAVSACRMYKITEDGDELGVNMYVEHDGIRTFLTGCKGSVTVGAGEKPSIACELNVDHYIKEINAAPYNPSDDYSVVNPALEKDLKAYLDGTGVDIEGLGFQSNTTVAPKNVKGLNGINGRAGYHITDRYSGGNFRRLIASDGVMEDDIAWQSGTVRKVEAVFGYGAECFAVRVPVAELVEPSNDEDGDGMRMAPNVFRANYAGQAEDPADGTVQIPDMAICIF